MKITYIVPGSGGTFYCGNCLRDWYFTDILKESGHEITVIPMYLPLSVDHFEADTPIFYGAVNLYLQQMMPFLKKMPKFIKKIFDSKALLKFAAKKSGSTDPTGLEGMTISMLKGENGKQKEDLDILINWLKNHEKPDIVHLSNALLTGLAKKIKTEVGCKIVCTIQDEDEWIDEMQEPFKTESWKLIEENIHHVDALISVSEYYSNLFKNRVNVPDKKVSIVFNSICLSDMKEKSEFTDHTIGYMSQINSKYGADILFDAYLILKQEKQFNNLKLIYTGGYTHDHKKIVKKIKSKIKQHKLKDDVTFFDDISTEGKNHFLDRISLMCVPSRRKGGFGMFLLEAFANEIPVIMPDHGAYPELINAHKTGILYKENNSEQIADAIKSIISDQKKYTEHKNNCHTAVNETFNNKTQIKKIIKVYEQSLKN